MPLPSSFPVTTNPTAQAFQKTMLFIWAGGTPETDCIEVMRWEDAKLVATMAGAKRGNPTSINGEANAGYIWTFPDNTMIVIARNGNSIREVSVKLAAKALCKQPEHL
jgi:hypothetical protein